ncbi:LacI family transcriptional regulator [Polynucleobacter wuianus]|uniref:LacI family transcriptional regulator n=1 Tax=Polynucleobacter wuianus TaxID=1743168 RepID=A0A191UE00_9BURK|nr:MULTISPECIES: tripartite tricarboxylate transporter substrate binding protein [Polynucleobacter]ANI99288.1 LacI family transcriptional regulator [Polynucleobacter wuianus]MBU3552120.1 tripartite tricarboxylate transporter substrate binding protein [Polynucleobacter sp. MWH-Post4-6-1]
MYQLSKLTKYFCIAIMGLLATVSHAQTASFPDRPVTIVVPFPPGGGTDAGARLIAQKLSTRWGQSVIIDNKAGASGMVGSEFVSRAKPDGYTLLIGNIGTFSINPSLYKKMPYDPDKAFVPVSMIAELPYFLLVTPSMKANNVKEFIAFAKANPGAVTYASSGSGSGPHLAGEMFEKATGLDMMHVPYKGGGPAAADVMAGHVNMYFSTVLESIGSVKSGKLKALGASSLVRSPAMPELPTIAESGVPGFDAASWIGIAAPAGTPPALVDKIAADIKAVISEQDTKQTLIQQGATPMPLSPTAFKARIESDRVRYAKVIKEGNVQVD